MLLNQEKLRNYGSVRVKTKEKLRLNVVRVLEVKSVFLMNSETIHETSIEFFYNRSIDGIKRILLLIFIILERLISNQKNTERSFRRNSNALIQLHKLQFRQSFYNDSFLEERTCYGPGRRLYKGNLRALPAETLLRGGRNGYNRVRELRERLQLEVNCVQFNCVEVAIF